MPLKTSQPTVQHLADIVFNHLIENPGQLAEFMNITGTSPESLRHSVGSSAFARGLLDYLVQNEPLLLAICSAHALSPDSVMRVWARLNPAG